jgi:hypothetical protein
MARELLPRAGMKEATRAEGIRVSSSYLDYLCEVWRIRRDRASRPGLEGNTSPSDIYAVRPGGEAKARFGRPRGRWPYG